jgi:hypothetical protein
VHEKYLFREDFSRKGAKAQSAAALLKGFLCAFAGEIFFQNPALQQWDSNKRITRKK